MRWIALGSLALAGLGCSSGSDASFAVPPTAHPSAAANPFLGSGGQGFSAGSAFPGAGLPNGLAKPGPDTSGEWGTAQYLHFVGYWWGDDRIQGFSQTHLHGTGACDDALLTLMPLAAWDGSQTTPDRYQSPFRKSSERALPGRYEVTLDQGNILVELTSTERVALHRYTYPADAREGHVVVDLDHHLELSSVRDASATVDAASRTIAGRLHSLGQLSQVYGGYELYFALRAAQPWTRAVAWHDGAAPAEAASVAGAHAGLELDFDVSSGAPLEIRVGLSMVSTEAASASLGAEADAIDFDAARDAAQTSWDDVVGRVHAEGGTDEQRAILASAMRHAFVMPTVMSERDGSYAGADGRAGTAAGFDYVSDLSLWDTYRTLQPLYALVAPARARDVVRSLHEMAKALGHFPMLPIGTGDSGTMVGASAEAIVADAYAKGVTDFDAEGAYQLLRAAALADADPPGGRGGRAAVGDYARLGYVPSTTKGSVSITTEYGDDDFALGQLAGALGHADDAAALDARRKSWRNLFDPATGFLWAKDATGAWATPHDDPKAFSTEFVEATAWQSVWMAAHDPEGLATLLGGADAAVAKLESFFEQARTEHETHVQKDDLPSAWYRPAWYWHGNEPDIHAAYLFAQFGRPDLTQKWVRWIEGALYANGPEGLAGNDDGGTLAAWYVFSAMGLYPIPGSDRYVVGAPLFPHLDVRVKDGTFAIDAPDVSDANLYVQAVTLNGAPLDAPALRHADLRAGGSLAFAMGPSPSAWGKPKP